jgi:hypothetical protein
VHETDVQATSNLCWQILTNDLGDALADAPRDVGVWRVRPLRQHGASDSVLTMPAHEVNFANTQ